MQVGKNMKRICAIMLAACMLVTAAGPGNVKAGTFDRASKYSNMARMAGVEATADSVDPAKLSPDKAIDGDTAARDSRYE